MKKRALFLSLLSLVFIAGCGENAFKGQEDKNSTEAKQFDISAQLDAGNYGEILAHPEDVNATDYAAAAMGAAGLDPVKLIQAMNDAATAGTTSDLGPVTSLVLDPAALDELQTAKDKLATELAANPTDPDLNFQMTLTSLTSTLTALAAVGEDSTNGIRYLDPDDGQTKSFEASDGISTEEADALGIWLSTNSTATVNADVNGDNVVDASDTLITLITNDVANIVNTLPNANLGTGSDLNTVLTDATSSPTGLNYGCTDSNADGKCDDNNITANEISQYLQLVL